MSQSKQLINEFVTSLQGVTDEKTIKKLTVSTWKQLKALIPNENTFRRTRSDLRKAIELAFPVSEVSQPGYYFTAEGKGKKERYQHLSLWYATTNQERWGVVGDSARRQYFANLPGLSETKPETQPETQPQSELQPKPQPQSSTLKLENMTLQNLELDDETQATVQNALNHSGMSLADFIKQACKVYAKTVMGKAKQADSDLTCVPTSELLNNSAYRTLPGRVDELSRRAVQAIMHHNDMSTEKNQKWCITATAINGLTGSKMNLIKLVMEQFNLAISEHNTKHQLNPYDNRGRSQAIDKDIDFSNFPVDKPIATPEVKVKPAVPAVPAAPKEVSAKKTEAASEVKPKEVESKAKVITLPITATTIEIHEQLKANPDRKVRVRDGRKALTYSLSDGKVKLEETGEVENLIV